MSKRWDVAQQYEKSWWNERREAVDFEFYKNFAEDLVEQTRTYIKISPETSILEIGSGAGGILTYLNSKDRNAIDPLEDYYTSVPEFVKQRDKNVQYQKAKAEELPFDDDRFDFIICDNVLDHCDDVDAVFHEIHRVLHDGGIVYLRLHVYHAWGKLIRSMVELLGIDPGHPYTFTPGSTQEALESNKFIILKRSGKNFIQSWMKSLRSRSIKELLKAVTFSTPSKPLYILRKQP
jgi:ubiquinone/menaquinone biosynthesis C-methylase UbiE